MTSRPAKTHPAIGAVALLVVLLAACGESHEPAVAPRPATLDRGAIGHYCNMIVADHPGPKAQIHLDDRSAPLWFSSVRDALAFTFLPEEPHNIAAFYVNDMSDADWADPDAAPWIPAREAWFVLDSERTGGMGAPAVAPFATERDARAFAERHGGRVVRLAAIVPDDVLGPVATPPRTDGPAPAPAGPDGGPHGDAHR